MKVVVYAICKNESAFVERWMNSMSEADKVVVLDTGSTDDTVEQLRDRGAFVVSEVIYPWRFDTARNRSLELVDEDADICVCTDLDEVFLTGWRAELEEKWTQDTVSARYRYTWSFLPDGREDIVFWMEKVHARRGFRWVNPVHEVLTRENGLVGNTITLDRVCLEHYPDNTKSRGQYLPLLELSVKENPNDDRSRHYLGREYMYKHRWDDCIRTLCEHLAMPTATWADERAASMRYIARALEAKGDASRAESWLLRAAAEAPHLREAYLELASLLYRQKNWEGVLYFTSRALAITERPRTYISEGASWGSLPHDLRALALYNTGREGEALAEYEKALSLEPENERIASNISLIKGRLSQCEKD